MAWVPSTLWWRPHETWDGTNFNKRPSYPLTDPTGRSWVSILLVTKALIPPSPPPSGLVVPKSWRLQWFSSIVGLRPPGIGSLVIQRCTERGGWGKRRWSFLCDNSKKFLLNLKWYKRINSSSYILIIYMSQPNKLNLKLHFISNMLLNGLSIILKCHCIIMWAKVPFSQ